MPHVTIIGAGIAGLSTGWLLKQQGVDFTILEKQPYHGGLARSFEWHGFHCDFAAHRLFTTDENVLHELLRLVPMGRQIRRSRIFLRGHWMRDPLDVLELVQKLSLSERVQVLWHYWLRNKSLQDTHFENYVLKRYGRSLYHFFFQPYTEKLFGISGDQISVLWAQQKVRLANPLDNLRENTKTKFQYFYYPIRGGYGAIVNKLYDEVKEHVILNASVSGFDIQDDRIDTVRYRIGDVESRAHSDAVVSSLPLTLTSKMLGMPLSLKFQKVDAVYLWLNKSQLSDYHWIYFMDKEIAINRMVEFKNMSPVETPASTTVVCAEVTREVGNPAASVINDLVNTGLIQASDVLDKQVIREEFAYPVYDNNYQHKTQKAQEYLNRFKNLHVVGRAAEFRHREVDDNFTAAKQTADDILKQFPGVIRPPVEDIRVSAEKKIPQIYAVILAFNHYSDTQECLESVVKSDYENLQVVVVDNGSSDQTPANIRQDFPRVHIIENGANLGVPAGYNVGFRYALENGADYILLLNNDTVIAADMISKLLEHAESDPKCGMVMPKVFYYGSNSEVWSRGGRYRRFPPAILFNDRRQWIENIPVRKIEYAPTCGLLIHRRAFEMAGLFDPGYFFLYDDWDFSERVRAMGLNIWYIHNAAMWHKVSRTTRGSQSGLYWYTMGASSARFYRRHGRPVWLSLPMHIGFIIFREFLLKNSWHNWPDFWNGFKDGMQKPLGEMPQYQ